MSKISVNTIKKLRDDYKKTPQELTEDKRQKLLDRFRKKLKGNSLKFSKVFYKNGETFQETKLRFTLSLGKLSLRV